MGNPPGGVGSRNAAAEARSLSGRRRSSVFWIVDPMEIARRAGHSSVAFTYDRYGHLFPEPDTMAAAKLDAFRLKDSQVSGVR